MPERNPGGLVLVTTGLCPLEKAGKYGMYRTNFFKSLFEISSSMSYGPMKTKF